MGLIGAFVGREAVIADRDDWGLLARQNLVESSDPLTESGLNLSAMIGFVGEAEQRLWILIKNEDPEGSQSALTSASVRARASFSHTSATSSDTCSETCTPSITIEATPLRLSQLPFKEPIKPSYEFYMALFVGSKQLLVEAACFRGVRVTGVIPKC